MGLFGCLGSDMSKENPTFLEKGIFVTINEENLTRLKHLRGFLARENYIDVYEELAKENEVGRYQFLRILKE
jgi:hypothetical protein